MSKDVEIRYVNSCDKEFWFSLDKHLSVAEFDKKVRDKQGYVILAGDKPIGILRYNLFWDNTPFCTLLYISAEYHNQGFGKALMAYWESEMRTLGYKWLFVSTVSDESAQHFFRELGYKDCGRMSAPNQADELFLAKFL